MLALEHNEFSFVNNISEVGDQSRMLNCAVFVFYYIILNSARDTVGADDWCLVNYAVFVLS